MKIRNLGKQPCAKKKNDSSGGCTTNECNMEWLTKKPTHFREDLCLASPPRNTCLQKSPTRPTTNSRLRKLSNSMFFVKDLPCVFFITHPIHFNARNQQCRTWRVTLTGFASGSSLSTKPSTSCQFVFSQFDWKSSKVISQAMLISGKWCKLVGGFNPFEKHSSKWESSPNRGENKKSLKPPPRKWWKWKDKCSHRGASIQACAAIVSSMSWRWYDWRWTNYLP